MIAKLMHVDDQVDAPIELISDDSADHLMMAAGISTFEMIWQKNEADIWNAAVDVVTK